MTGYPAWIDGEQGAYGVSFPDLPGIVAMGATVDEALLHAEEALRDYVTETESDGQRSSTAKRGVAKFPETGYSERHALPPTW